MGDTYQTVKDVIVQMLASPEWLNQFNSFVEDNCIFFQSDEENSVQQNTIFQNFQKEMASVYDQFFNALGLESCEDVQAQVLQDMIKNPDDTEIEQLLALGDYTVFKSLMAYQNKCRELNALEQLVGSDDDDEQFQQQEDDEQDDNIGQLRIKLEFEQVEDELMMNLAMQMSLDSPDQNRVKELEDKLNKVREQLSQYQEQQGMYQDRVAKLKDQLDVMPTLNKEEAQMLLKQLRDSI